MKSPGDDDEHWPKAEVISIRCVDPALAPAGPKQYYVHYVDYNKVDEMMVRC